MNVDSFIRLSELFEHHSVDRKVALEFFYTNDTKLFYWVDSTHKECRENQGKVTSFRSTFEGHGYFQIDRDDSSLALIRKEKLIRANARPFIFTPDCLKASQFSYEFRLKKQSSFIVQLSKRRGDQKVTLDVEQFDPIELDIKTLKEALCSPESEYSLAEARDMLKIGTETYFSDYAAFASEVIRNRIQSLKLTVDTSIDDLFVRREDAEKIPSNFNRNLLPVSEETRVHKLQEIISTFMFLLVKSQILLGEPNKKEIKEGEEFEYYPTHNEAIMFLRKLKISIGKDEKRFSKEGFAKAVLKEIKRDIDGGMSLSYQPDALGFESFVDYLDEFMSDKTDSWPQNKKIPKWIRNSK